MRGGSLATPAAGRRGALAALLTTEAAFRSRCDALFRRLCAVPSDVLLAPSQPAFAAHPPRIDGHGQAAHLLLPAHAALSANVVPCDGPRDEYPARALVTCGVGAAATADAVAFESQAAAATDRGGGSHLSDAVAFEAQMPESAAAASYLSGGSQPESTAEAPPPLESHPDEEGSAYFCEPTTADQEDLWPPPPPEPLGEHVWPPPPAELLEQDAGPAEAELLCDEWVLPAAESHWEGGDCRDADSEGVFLLDLLQLDLAL